jgi:hypothetical protein
MALMVYQGHTHKLFCSSRNFSGRCTCTSRVTLQRTQTHRCSGGEMAGLYAVATRRSKQQKITQHGFRPHFTSRSALNAKALKQNFTMRDATKCSKLRLPALRARRTAKIDIWQLEQHSSCTRCLLLRHHSCIDASSNERCDSVNPSWTGGCRQCARALRGAKMGQVAAAFSTRDMTESCFKGEDQAALHVMLWSGWSASACFQYWFSVLVLM